MKRPPWEPEDKPTSPRSPCVVPSAPVLLGSKAEAVERMPRPFDALKRAFNFKTLSLTVVRNPREKTLSEAAVLFSKLVRLRPGKGSVVLHTPQSLWLSVILISSWSLIINCHRLQDLAIAFSQSPGAHPQKPNNDTILKISRQLCWGCIGESLQFLFQHNMVRAAKWEMPLMWDFQLERYARWWAGIRKADCKLQHSFPEDGFKLGENIYWGSGSTWTPIDAVNTWAAAEKCYTYATNTCEAGQMCGHYTQIVWKSTRRVGCARVVCDDGDVFMTCNYDPPGNYIGEKPY
ncbi:hypothetical protein ACLB2K_041555 [Fragaria x ananassa]